MGLAVVLKQVNSNDSEEFPEDLLTELPERYRYSSSRMFPWRRRTGLEPATGIRPLPPQDSVSTNSTTSAKKTIIT